MHKLKSIIDSHYTWISLALLVYIAWKLHKR